MVPRIGAAMYIWAGQSLISSPPRQTVWSIPTTSRGISSLPSWAYRIAAAHRPAYSSRRHLMGTQHSSVVVAYTLWTALVGDWEMGAYQGRLTSPISMPATAPIPSPP